jgi:small subunit ribosomal protein S2
MERNESIYRFRQVDVKKAEELMISSAKWPLDGGTVLFVGHMHSALDAVKEEAEKVGMYYVNARSSAE